MALTISFPDNTDLKPKIAVFGVGGAGCNAVNNMIESELQGVEFYVANTDAQALSHALTPNRLQLGPLETMGLGAGSHPEKGKAAAEESLSELLAAMDNANMIFITAGMGGGTGTGSAPVIAKAAKERGILTVGVVTKPFHFEGIRRMKIAELGLEEMQKYVDTLIVIPNQNLFRIANEKTTFADAFKMADKVLHSGVCGVTDLMVLPGLINLDFADVRTVMSEMGKAMMGTGEAEGENRAIKAAEAAISNPLLESVSMKGARGVLINVTGGLDMTLFEVDEAANRIREEVDPEANIIFGSAFNKDLKGIRVSVVATGIDAEHFKRSKVELVYPTNAESSTITQTTIKIEEKSQANDGICLTTPPANTQDLRPEAIVGAAIASAFIPPKAIDPEELSANMHEELDFEEENIQSNAASNIVTEEKEEGNSAGGKSAFSIFGKVASGFSRANEANAKSEVKSTKEDFFEIPAFLRRKGSND